MSSSKTRDRARRKPASEGEERRQDWLTGSELRRQLKEAENIPGLIEGIGARTRFGPLMIPTTTGKIQTSAPNEEGRGRLCTLESDVPYLGFTLRRVG